MLVLEVPVLSDLAVTLLTAVAPRTWTRETLQVYRLLGGAYDCHADVAVSFRSPRLGSPGGKCPLSFALVGSGLLSAPLG